MQQEQTMSQDKQDRPAALLVWDGPLAGSRFALAGGSLVIGRADDEKAIYPDIDLSAADTATPPSLSRRHARIVREQGGLMIQDLGSTNGTRINDRPAPAEATQLLHGDRLRFGNVTVVVDAPAYPRPAAPAIAAPRSNRLVAAVLLPATVVIGLLIVGMFSPTIKAKMLALPDRLTGNWTIATCAAYPTACQAALSGPSNTNNDPIASSTEEMLGRRAQ
jgi:hypothetical protein